MPDDDFQKKLTAKRDEEARVSGTAPAAPAQAAAPVPTANQTQTFEDAEGARASAVATEAAQPAAPAQPAPAQPSDGTKEVAPGETAPVESDDVKKLRLQLENQLRIKGIDTALQLWRDARSREQALQDKELDFERWKQQNAITERNSMIRQLSGARDIKWTYHGTFANGVLTSNWSGTATNPYKDLLQKLEGEAAGDNPYAAFRESTRKSGLEAPDWLKALLPDGGDGRKPAGELDVRPGEQPPAQQRRGTSVVTAYRELSRPGDYLKAGRTSRIGFGPESLTLFRETRAQSGNRTLTERRERTTFGVPILENIR